MDKLYGYVFHYNFYKGLWNAIPRELYIDYWNNENLEGVLRSKEYSTLVEMITKGVTFVDPIKKIYYNQPL